MPIDTKEEKTTEEEDAADQQDTRMSFDQIGTPGDTRRRGGGGRRTNVNEVRRPGDTTEKTLAQRIVMIREDTSPFKRKGREEKKETREGVKVV